MYRGAEEGVRADPRVMAGGGADRAEPSHQVEVGVCFPARHEKFVGSGGEGEVDPVEQVLIEAVAHLGQTPLIGNDDQH